MEFDNKETVECAVGINAPLSDYFRGAIEICDTERPDSRASLVWACQPCGDAPMWRSAISGFGIS
jgi:hypothetical protein